MHHVPCNDGFLALRADVHADVSGRVAGSWNEGHLIGNVEVRADELHQARGDDRIERVLEMPQVVIAAGALQVLPVIPLLAAEVVARLRESGNPLAVDQLRVPADMIEVQMRAQHAADGFRGKARSGEVLQEARLQVAEDIVLALPVRPDAGIDHDAPAPGAQHERLEGDEHPAAGGCEPRGEPWESLHQLGRAAWQEHRDVVLECVDLHDPRDFDVADLPVPDVFDGHTVPLSRSIQRRQCRDPQHHVGGLLGHHHDRCVRVAPDDARKRRRVHHA